MEIKYKNTLNDYLNFYCFSQKPLILIIFYGFQSLFLFGIIYALINYDYSLSARIIAAVVLIILWIIYRAICKKLNIRAIGKGLIKTAVVEVEPFSSSQAEAEKAGIQKFALSDGRENVYLGMSLTDERGRTLAIPRLIPERRDELESDISRLISILAAGRQPRLGVLSPYFRAEPQIRFDIMGLLSVS